MPDNGHCSPVTFVYSDAGKITGTTRTSLDGPTVALAHQYDNNGNRAQMAAYIDGAADFVDDCSHDPEDRNCRNSHVIH